MVAVRLWTGASLSFHVYSTIHVRSGNSSPSPVVHTPAIGVESQLKGLLRRYALERVGNGRRLLVCLLVCLLARLDTRLLLLLLLLLLLPDTGTSLMPRGAAVTVG